MFSQFCRLEVQNQVLSGLISLRLLSLACRRARGAVIENSPDHEEVLSPTGYYYGTVGSKWVQACTGRPCEMPLNAHVHLPGVLECSLSSPVLRYPLRGSEITCGDRQDTAHCRNHIAHTFFFKMLFILSWLCLVFCYVWAFLSCSERAYSVCVNFLLQWLLVAEHRLWVLRASVAVCTGLVAPPHVESSLTRD